MITYTAKDILTPGNFIDLADVRRSLATIDPVDLTTRAAAMRNEDHVRTAYFQYALRAIRAHHGNRCAKCGEAIRGAGQILNKGDFPPGTLHLDPGKVVFVHHNQYACKAAQAHRSLTPRKKPYLAPKDISAAWVKKTKAA